MLINRTWREKTSLYQYCDAEVSGFEEDLGEGKNVRRWSGKGEEGVTASVCDVRAPQLRVGCGPPVFPGCVVRDCGRC